MARVICPVCKSEFDLENHDEMTIHSFYDNTNNVIGTLVPSKVGSVKGENKMNEMNVNEMVAGMTTEQKAELIKALSLNTFNSINADTTSVDLTDPTSRRLSDNGYVKNMFHRRWITAQTMDLLGWRDGNYKKSNTWTKRFNQRYGYPMMFDVTRDELKRLYHLEQKDSQAFNEEVQFFDTEVVIALMNDYIKVLKSYVKTLNIKHCKGVPYVHLGRCYVYNTTEINQKLRKYGLSDVVKIKEFLECNKQNIFVEDLNKKVYTIENLFVRAAALSQNYEELYEIFCMFSDFRYNPFFITKPMSWNLKKPAEWVDAFKGAGAYYSMDNLIKFSGLKLKNYSTDEVLGTQDSLKYLKEMAKQTKGERYKLLALLKESLVVNNFNFEKVIKK